jgi:hypothetical protein
VTSRGIANEIARGGAASNPRRTALLESLEQALAALTVAEFGREGTLDDNALDEALATGVRALRRMKIEQTWLMKRLAARRAGTPMDNRAWSR